MSKARSATIATTFIRPRFTPTTSTVHDHGATSNSVFRQCTATLNMQHHFTIFQVDREGRGARSPKRYDYDLQAPPLPLPQ